MLSSCVRLSVTSREFTKMAKPQFTQTTPYDSPGILVFDAKNIWLIPTGSSPPNRSVV